MKCLAVSLTLAAGLVVGGFGLGRSSVETQPRRQTVDVAVALRAAEAAALQAGPGYGCWPEINAEQPGGYEVICSGPQNF